MPEQVSIAPPLVGLSRAVTLGRLCPVCHRLPVDPEPLGESITGVTVQGCREHAEQAWQHIATAEQQAPVPISQCRRPVMIIGEGFASVGDLPEPSWSESVEIGDHAVIFFAARFVMDAIVTARQVVDIGTWSDRAWLEPPATMIHLWDTALEQEFECTPRQARHLADITLWMAHRVGDDPS